MLIAGFFANSPSVVYEMGQLPKEEKSTSSGQQLRDLKIDQLLQVEAVRFRYQTLVVAYKEKFAAEQKIFKEGFKWTQPKI